MKQTYTLILLLLISLTSFGQITFDLNRIQLDDATNVYEQWDHIRLFSTLPESYAEYGYQYEVRNDQS